MADLDDFFAKKDRKKSKGTKKFSTTEEVAKKLEDTTNKKQEKAVKKDRPQEGEDGTVQTHDQDEWKEFEEEKKDYTGLKIGNLTINSNAEGASGNPENNPEQQQQYDESGNEIEKKVGPWKRMDNKEEVEVVKEEKKPDPVPIVTTPNVTSGGTYIPPSLRNQQPVQPLQPSRLRSKVAPDIHNEEFFPCLSGSKDKKNRNEGSFEVVSHNKSQSLRQVEQTKMASGQGTKLALGNRYNTLSNDS